MGKTEWADTCDLLQYQPIYSRTLRVSGQLLLCFFDFGSVFLDLVSSIDNVMGQREP